MSQGERPLYHLTVREAGDLIRRRQLSPVELTRAFLERIQAVDGRLKTYVTLLAESAMAEAQAAEGEIARGGYRGPLHGIPVALKDLYDTKGVRTTAQSKVLEHRVPAEDATTTARLRGAGAVLLGKLALHEFALGGPQTSIFEQARNPWDLERVTGGSSSGSGAAVAAGLCMASLGSDTGGSIRAPASLCGIVGLKPTYGLVSRYGVVPLSWSLDHCGPMTWTVEDAALVLQTIAGPDPKDPTTSAAPLPDYTQALREDVRGLRIGVPRHYFLEPRNGVEPETAAAVEQALKDLEGLGARVEEVTVPSLEYAWVANSVILLAEAAAYHRRNLQARPREFGDIVRVRFFMGALLSGVDYVQAQRARSRVRRELAEVLRRVDVLAAPTQPKPAARFQGFDPFAIGLTPSFTSPFNLAGVPAISVPCGFSGEGLPIGLQIAVRPFDEPTVLRVAHTYERHAGWYRRRPRI